MRPLSKLAAMSLGVLAALSATVIAQARAPKGASQELVVGGTVEWIEKSDVSALREGVIKEIELREGMTVRENMFIAKLHDESAILGTSKARLISQNRGQIMKAEAQYALAVADLARFEAIQKRGANFVSTAEVQKAVAEVKVGEAAIQEAKENVKVAEAELAVAQQIVEEHTIRAPFDGIIIKRIKHPGETVRANEAVVRLGKIDHVRFYGFIPIENLSRVKVGMVVDVRPTIEDAELPIEQKRFRGKISALGTEVNGIGKTEVEIYADVANNKDTELRPGLRADMTIYLDPAAVPPPPADMLPQLPQVANSNK